jgi:hypothetical protein
MTKTISGGSVDVTDVRKGPSCGLKMDGMRGWLAGAGHPDPSLSQFSDVVYNTRPAEPSTHYFLNVYQYR